MPPPNYDSILRGIETAETIISNQEKMNSLQALAKEVYEKREATISLGQGEHDRAQRGLQVQFSGKFT